MQNFLLLKLFILHFITFSEINSQINLLEKKLSLNFKLQKHLYYARKELHKIIQKKINDHDYAYISQILEKNEILFSKYESASEFVNGNPNCNLDNPILKVTSPNTHIPFAPILEDAFIPSAEKVIKAIKELQ